MSTNASDIFQYTFKIKSTDSKLFEVDTEKSGSSNLIKDISVSDSIFSLYPTGYYSYEDPSASVFSTSAFAEKEQIEVEIAVYQSDVKLTHKFMWTSAMMEQVKLDKNVNGVNIDNFISYYKYYDYSDFKTYPVMSPDLVVQSIVSKFGTPPPISYVTPCINRRNWHQGGKTVTSFINDILLRYARDINEYPFVSYFNLKNEFHFRSLKSLYQNVPPSPPPLNSPSLTPVKYKIDFTDGLFTNRVDYIQSVEYVQFPGYTYNVDNYTVEYKYYLGNDSKKEKVRLKEYLINPNSLYPLKNELIPPFKPSYNIFLGYFSSDDSLSAEGKLNNYYLNTLCPLRMKVIIYFNPELVAGRTMEIESYINKDGEINKMLSGEWLIVTSTHRYYNIPEIKATTVFTYLELAKPDIAIDDVNFVLQRG